MSIKSEVVSVGTTATLIGNFQSGAVVVPTGGSTVYVGGADVTTSTGFPVAAGENLSVELDSNSRLYGVVAADTQDVNLLVGY